jgi:protein SCO1/2
MNRNLVQIQNSFSEFQDFGIASFTINPEYDTQEVLKAYVENYGIINPNWHLMTGDKETIYDLANIGFNIYAGENPNADDGFEHSGNFALIDKNGFMRSRQDNFGNPKIFYKGIVSEEEKIDDDGEAEEISMLKEDIAKLLKEN